MRHEKAQYMCSRETCTPKFRNQIVPICCAISNKHLDCRFKIIFVFLTALGPNRDRVTKKEVQRKA